MRIRKLEYLVALAREGHFARAAAACHVSQPTLSTALRQLEIDMGVTILKRGLRYSGLTEQGERLLAFAQRMAVECEHLHRDLECMGGDSRGMLQIGVVPSATPIVPSLAASFYKQYPKVKVKLMELNPRCIQRGFEDFALDVAVTYLDKTNGLQGRSRLLYRERYCLLARRGVAFSDRKSASWEEALQLPLCLFSPDELGPNSPVAGMLEKGSASGSRIETNSVTAVHSYVRFGPWIGVLPRSLAVDLQATGDFHVIDLPEVSSPVPVGLVIPERNATFPLAQAFFNIANIAGSQAVEFRTEAAASHPALGSLESARQVELMSSVGPTV
jgi:DNA-binding transcriptional LysR family regulator